MDLHKMLIYLNIRPLDHLKTGQSFVFSRGGSRPPNLPGILGGLRPSNSLGLSLAVGGDLAVLPEPPLAGLSGGSAPGDCPEALDAAIG